jgi:hypothetical protein
VEPIDAVEILGADGLVLRRAGASSIEIRKSPIPSAILAMLAAEPYGVGAQQIRDVVAGRLSAESMGKDSLDQHIRRLRHNFGVAVTTEKGPTRYRLDPAETAVDAFRFIDQAAAGEPGDIDRLLRMWHGDPRSANAKVASAWWARSALFKARGRLVARIRDMRAEDRVTLAALTDFAALFPDDPEINPIRPTRSAPLPRVVVVDDLIADTIIAGLPPSCDYRPITSLAGWNDFVRNGGLDDVRGVLVDLHLTATLADRQGYVIADYLRDTHPSIPAIVMTAAPPARLRHVCDQHRLLDIVFKGRDGELNMAALAEAVTALVGAGKRHQRDRMRAQLDSCRYLVEVEDRQTWSEERVKEFQREADRVERVIANGDPTAARRAVDGLWRDWSRR